LGGSPGVRVESVERLRGAASVRVAARARSIAGCLGYVAGAQVLEVALAQHDREDGCAPAGRCRRASSSSYTSSTRCCRSHRMERGGALAKLIGYHSRSALTYSEVSTSPSTPQSPLPTSQTTNRCAGAFVRSRVIADVSPLDDVLFERSMKTPTMTLTGGSASSCSPVAELSWRRSSVLSGATTSRHIPDIRPEQCAPAAGPRTIDLHMDRIAPPDTARCSSVKTEIERVA